MDDTEARETVRDLLLDHRGADNPISSREINDVIDVDNVGSFPTTRRLVREVMEREKVPIASGNEGYYMIETADELEDEIESINDRIGSIAERRVRLREAAYERADEIEGISTDDV